MIELAVVFIVGLLGAVAIALLCVIIRDLNDEP